MACWQRRAEAEVEAEPLNLNLNLNLTFALAEAGVCLAVAAVALRVARPAILRQAQVGALRLAQDDALRPAQDGSTLAWLEAARLWRLAGAVARRLPRRPTCLAQALAVGWMLRRRGIATTLRFGVRVADGVFTAHAWLECAGRIVGPAHVTEIFIPLEPITTTRPYISN